MVATAVLRVAKFQECLGELSTFNMGFHNERLLSHIYCYLNCLKWPLCTLAILLIAFYTQSN